MSKPEDEKPLQDLTSEDNGPWYQGITRYQWLVLLIASLGWIFDIFEGQIFIASMNEAMPSLIQVEGAAELPKVEAEQLKKDAVTMANYIALAAFLVGGAVGGIVFGMLSDRIGRKRTMSVTIIFYSVFTCISAFSQEWWHLAGLRFLVAMGVGGEWAIASALVAEVFPKRARVYAGGIFHASSVFGTYLAVAAGYFIIANGALNEWAATSAPEWISSYIDPRTIPWRLGFALGALPALLIIWIRISLKEPESWQAARDLAQKEPGSKKMGSLTELFHADYVRATLVGVSLAAVGMATFWGAHVHGRVVLQDNVKQQYIDEASTGDKPLSDEAKAAVLKDNSDPIKRWEMIGMFLVTTGGGFGLISFAPVSRAIGRRGAFMLFHAGGLLVALFLFLVEMPTLGVMLVLPVFGFLTLGMHAGYAIYFPELYPTRLRGTGAGFCFNAGRILAAPILIVRGVLTATYNVPADYAYAALSSLFLLGVVVLIFAPETNQQELPE